MAPPGEVRTVCAARQSESDQALAELSVAVANAHDVDGDGPANEIQFVISE